MRHSDTQNPYFVGLIVYLATATTLAGCVTTSEVMDTGNGTYMISARASPIRGGAAGANEAAYRDAQTFCAKQGGHAVVLGANARDVYQGGYSAGPQFAGGGFNAAGNTDMHFRCTPS